MLHLRLLRPVLFIIPVLLTGSQIRFTVAGPRAVLFHTTLDDVAAITSPVAGVGGTTTLSAADFVAGQTGNGARFVGPGKVTSFPAVSGGVQNVEFDRGEIELWYRPNYDAGSSDDVAHTLIVVGDIYNAPRLTLAESDRLSLTLVDGTWGTHSASTGYHAPVWTAGQWVHLRAAWDTAQPTDSLQLYVNGTRVDQGGVAGGWTLGSEANIGRIFAGSANATGDFVADGVLDELIIRDVPQPPPTVTSTPTSTQTATPAPTATPTASPTIGPSPPASLTPTSTPTSSNAGISDPNLNVTPANLALPPAGTPFVDPVLRTTLRRVSNTSDSGNFETQEYSQLQAFSADNAYMLLVSPGGYLVRRVDNLSRVNGLNSPGWNAARWYTPQPHTLIHFDDNADTTIRVQLTQVDTLTTTTIYTFPVQYQRVVVNRSADELSEDGRWLTGVVARDDGAWVLFALDTLARQLGAVLPIPDLYASACQPDPQWGQVPPDWVAASPLGRYLVVQWTRDGTQRCSGLETFDLRTGAFAGRVYDGHQHGDLGIGADGMSEFFMTFELYHPSGRPALGVRALPGTSTVSAPTYVQMLDWGNGEYISCRGPAGVCLVTAGSDPLNGWTPFEAELFLQYTDGRVLRLAHHRSSSCGYWVAPRASLSRDGRFCDADADRNGIVNIVDIQMRASQPGCLSYLPLIASFWRTAGPGATPTASPTTTPH